MIAKVLYISSQSNLQNLQTLSCHHYLSCFCHDLMSNSRNIWLCIYFLHLHLKLFDSMSIMLKLIIAFEQKERFCKTMSLYNYKSKIFLFTFHIKHMTHFLHCKTWCLQSFHTYWVFLDLQSCKSTKIFNFKNYIQCVLVIWVWWQFNQSSQTSTFCQNAKKVSAYLL